ncbi:MAG: chromosome segregation protein SMC [Sporomusaceae bacterium]|nr:chromosome segregation protein SMC [Sporomusaceae bacterium]
MLRKIEAYGFKSFAEKTEIALGPGVTAIVGPNGSGKSNISDAIRWALGEQSLKSLRGAKSEDVIFAGSQGRRALGIAEVSLFFDNSDGLLPLDFNEVVITRRVFRSGDSEYYINKSSCRLKDIHELFADTGIGRDSMMVIGQNKIDEILNAKPEERRLLFEEAAGITKYKQRKREALRKIEETENNLTRLSDITTEIEGQLGPLAASAEKTKAYNALYEQWLSYQVSQFLKRFYSASSIVADAQKDQKELTESETVLSSQMLLAETERDKKTEELAVKEETYRAALKDLQQIELDLNTLKATEELLTERQQQSEREWERLVTEQTTLALRNQENEAKLQEFNTALQSKAAEQQALSQQLMILEHDHEAIKEKTVSLEQEVDKKKEELFDFMQELVQQKNHCRDLDKELLFLVQQQAEKTKQLTEEKVLLAKTQETVAAEVSQLQVLETEREQLTNQQKTVFLESQAIETEISSQEDMVTKLQRRMHDGAARQKVLLHLQEDFDGFGRGIKSVLKAKQPWRSAIHGAIAQVIHVPQEYVKAVEVALGVAAQHLITATADTAKAAISYLKENNLGRVTFLPLDTVQKPSRRDYELKAVQEPGVLGFASDVITFDPCYEAAVVQVLGRTLLVTTIDQALAVAKKYKYMLRLVTLEGEILNPGGSLTGGSLGRKENSFIGRQSEIEELTKRLEQEKINLASQQEKLAVLRVKRQQKQTELNQCQVKFQEIEIKQAELKVHAEQSRQNQRRFSLSVQTLTEEIRQDREREKTIEQDLALLQVQVAAMDQTQEVKKAMIQQLQLSNKEYQEKVTQQQESVTTLKVELSALEQNLQSLASNCAFYETLLAESQEQDKKIIAEQQEIIEKRQEFSAEMTECKLRSEALRLEKAETEETIKNLYEEKTSDVALLQAKEKDMKELRRRLQDLQNRLHERELLIAKYQAEAIACEEQLLSQFHLSLSEAKDYYLDIPSEELQSKIKVFDQKIAELGPIHAGAIEEYEKLKERYEFLQSQYHDLISAKNYLVSIVQEMDQTMAVQFKAAFEAINGCFHDIFVRLFGGGQAKLVLQSPDNLLETGIEIVVQPPGKKQQYLSLFSGGERSLTVIALLFSFLSHRPAPFCMVDEIDAALDEANVNRFSEFLRDYAQKTQFIVVTHRKGTMEIADVMHGITMEESGVSKLISVKFSEKAG